MELTFLKQLMLIRNVNKKNAIFVIIGTFYIKGSHFYPRRHDLLTMSMNISNIAILNIEGAEYSCIVSRISKSEAINVMENIDLIGKSRAL